MLFSSRASVLKACTSYPAVLSSSTSAWDFAASRRAMQTLYPPSAKRRATAAPIASPAPTRRATPLDFDILVSRTSIRCRAYSFVRNHRVDGGVTVTEVTQYDAGVLTHPRRRAANDGLADLEDGCRLRLPHPAHRRLVELLDQTARQDLFVLDDFAAAQDRRARHVRGIQPLQPLGGGALSDVFLHLVDARSGVDKACPRCGEPLVPSKFRIARRPAKTLPFGIGNGASGDVA